MEKYRLTDEKRDALIEAAQTRINQSKGVSASVDASFLTLQKIVVLLEKQNTLLERPRLNFWRRLFGRRK
ncbi:MAG: hypothetical protein R6U58_08275 [Bacteroidales bacterium]